VPDAEEGAAIRAALEELPHFRLLPAGVVDELVEASTLCELQAGQMLIREGEAADAFFVIRAGRVRLFRATPDGRQQVLHHLGSGHAFAEAAVLTMRTYPASAEAVEAGTEVVRVDRRRFLEVFEGDPAVAAGMVASLCGWLLRLVGRVEELTAASAAGRLARHLLGLPARGRAGEQVIELAMAKKDLAGHLGMTPETLSRLLRRWSEDGVARSSGREIVILDGDALEEIAGNS
jgi:CRP/FNR family transcriptional regulator